MSEVGTAEDEAEAEEGTVDLYPHSHFSDQRTQVPKQPIDTIDVDYGTVNNSPQYADIPLRFQEVLDAVHIDRVNLIELLISTYNGPTDLKEASANPENLPSAEHQYQLGMICLISPNNELNADNMEALEHFKIAADEGHKIAADEGTMSGRWQRC